MKWLHPLLGGLSNVQLPLHFLEVFPRLTELNFGKLNCFTRNWSLANKVEQCTMAEGDENLELKFRIFDGTDIGQGTYPSSTTIATLKQRLLSEWPQDKSVVPKSVSDMKLIHAGKVLDNGKTLAESKLLIGDLPGGVITMHVVIQPSVAKRKTDKDQSEKQNKSLCSCTIL